jgi:hypothetical protein
MNNELRGVWKHPVAPSSNKLPRKWLGEILKEEGRRRQTQLVFQARFEPWTSQIQVTCFTT